MQADEVVAQLGQLAEADRRWILGRLSADDKRRLADTLRVPSNPAAPHSNKTTNSKYQHASALVAHRRQSNNTVEIITHAPANEILVNLQGQPSWLIAVILFAHQWPWRQQVLATLTSTQRYEIQQLQHNRTLLADAVTRVLLETLAKKLAPLSATVSLRPTFSVLLQRFMKSVRWTRQHR